MYSFHLVIGRTKCSHFLMVQYFYESNQAKPPGNAASVDRLGVIHLVRALNFLKSGYFLLPDTHTYVCVSRVKKCEFTNDPLQQ